MPTRAELPLRCTCGRLRGRARDLGPRAGVRLACYCRDCQAFAYFLERADEQLDAHGGTEVYQLAPARVELVAGHEQLACVRLSEGGLMRWYASCCNTALGNTLARASVPFVGLISSCWEPSLDAAARDALLGPLRARFNGPGHADASKTMAKIDRAPLGTILRSIRVLARSFVRREQRPSPFFDDAGAPRASPRILDEPTRARLYAQLPQ